MKLAVTFQSLLTAAVVLGATSYGFAQSTPDSFSPAMDARVETIAAQSDGKVLVAGEFLRVGNQWRTNFARLNVDGTLDTSFVPAVPMFGRRIIVQPDGKILVGGIRPGPQPGDYLHARFIVRFETNGAVDASFDCPLHDMPFALALQADGKVLAGFQTQPCLARYNSDGSPDNTFHAQADQPVYDLALLPDTRIIAAGYFQTVNGQPHRLLVRLDSDGSVDETFITQVDVAPWPWGVVRKVALQPDGKVVFGGGFTMVNGVARLSLGRVNPDGTVDRQFDASANGEVHSLQVQPNGRIVVAGDFTQLNGKSRVRLGRLNWDGSLDETLTAGADVFVRTTALQSDGKILVGGMFTNLGGAYRLRAGRLAADQNPAPLFIDAWSVRHVAPGTLRFSFLNPSAASLEVIASDNLLAPETAWIRVGTPTALGSGIYEFTDPDSARYTRRVYRLRTQ